MRLFSRCSAITTLGLLLVMVVICSSTVYAQPEQNEEAAEASGIEFQPRFGEYHYDITWGGNPIGTGIVSVVREDDHYVLKARSETIGLIDKLYQLRYMGETRIKTEELAPIRALVVDEDKKRRKVQEVHYPAADSPDSIKMLETRYPKKNGGGIRAKEYEFLAETGILDIFSAIFLARSFDWQEGEQHTFSVIIGSGQFEVTLSCIGATELSVEEESIPVWVIRPKASEITEKPSPPPKRKMLVYLSADESRDLIGFEVNLGFSSVKLDLVKYFDADPDLQ